MLAQTALPISGTKAYFGDSFDFVSQFVTNFNF